MTLHAAARTSWQAMACICLAGAAARAEAALSLPRTLIYVDPVDYERALILETCELQGLKTVQLWSAPYAEMIRNRMVLNDEQIEHLASHTAPPENFETEWAQQNLEEFPVLGVLCGSDAGLATAERLQHVLTPSRSNGILSARRDKLQMNEALSAAGLSTAAQASISSWEEAEAFLTALPAPLHAVVKPRRGQSSLRVGLATSLSQARHMVNALLETPTSLDSSEVPRGSALLQEYLRGDEWVVDTVSRAGEHKAVALWRYNKGPANGAPFVYAYDELMSVEGSRERDLIEYAFSALEALQWRYGPCHIEIKWTERGPVLVEVNAGRFNGVDFKLLVDALIGYNMYDATLAAYADEAAWESLPRLPPQQLRGAGRLVKLVSSVQGSLVQLRHVQEVESLPSCVAFAPVYTEEGEAVELTVDLASVAGFVTLMHEDAAVVQQDYLRLRELQETMFEVK